MNNLRGWLEKGEGLIIVLVLGFCFLFVSAALAGTDVPTNAKQATSAIKTGAVSTAAGQVAEKSDSVSPQNKININNADKETLMGIKGLGPTKAQNIIEYRKKFGPFKSYEDLLKVKGIGKKTLELIKPFITF